MKTSLRLFLAMLFAFVGITAWADVDYTVSLGTTTRLDRYTSAINLTSPSCGAQTVNSLQSGAKGQKSYWDCTSSSFTCKSGEEVSISVSYSGGSMHAYVYIDENGDGFSASNENIGDDHILKTGTDIDLRSYSRYNGGPNSGTSYNSKGVANDNITLPSFTAPTTLGTYRMRYKVDWNNIDPVGATTIVTNGGIIVDVMLKVVEEPDPCPVMSEFSNRKVYALKNNSTGNYLMGYTDNYLWSSGTKGESFNKEDGKFQWLVYYTEKGYFLYNIGQGRVANDTQGTNGKNYHWNLVDPESAPSYVVATTDGTTFAFHDRDFASGNMWLHNNNTYSTGITNWTEAGEPSRWILEEILEVPEENAGTMADVKAYMEAYEWPAEPEPEPLGVTLDNLTSGWYQMVVVNSVWTAAANEKMLSTLEIADGILHNGDYYDLVTTETNDALNTLVYVNNTGTEGTNNLSLTTKVYTITLATGNTVGKGFSRTGDANIGIDAPDALQWKLRLYASTATGGNYADIFTKDAKYVLGAGSSVTGSRLAFKNTDDMLAGYDVYTVAYDAEIVGTPTVTYTDAEYTGIKTVLAGGAFFIKKEVTPTYADFTSTEAGGYNTEVEIDTEAKTITVKKVTLTVEEMHNAAAAAKAILDVRGVGYPKAESAEYAALAACIAEAEAAETVNTAIYEALQAALEAYKACTDIEKPVVGKYYTVSSISSAAGNENLGSVTYAEEGITISASSLDAYLKCVKDADGKYVFQFAESGKYFVYKNGRGATEAGAGVNSNKGWSDGYAAEYAAFNVAYITSGSLVTVDRPFGVVSLTTDKRNATDTSAGCLIVKNATKGFDTSTAPFFNGTFTSAFAFEDVTAAYEAILLERLAANNAAADADRTTLATLQETATGLNAEENKAYITDADATTLATILGTTYSEMIDNALAAANAAGTTYATPDGFNASEIEAELTAIAARIAAAKKAALEAANQTAADADLAALAALQETATGLNAEENKEYINTEDAETLEYILGNTYSDMINLALMTANTNGTAYVTPAEFDAEAWAADLAAIAGRIAAAKQAALEAANQTAADADLAALAALQETATGLNAEENKEYINTEDAETLEYILGNTYSDMINLALMTANANGVAYETPVEFDAEAWAADLAAIADRIAAAKQAALEAANQTAANADLDKLADLQTTAAGLNTTENEPYITSEDLATLNEIAGTTYSDMIEAALAEANANGTDYETPAGFDADALAAELAAIAGRIEEAKSASAESPFDENTLYRLKTVRGYMPATTTTTKVYDSYYIVSTAQESESGLFQIVKGSEGYTLYNVGAEKYLNNNGTNANPYTDASDCEFKIYDASTIGGTAGMWIIESVATGKFIQFGGDKQLLVTDNWKDPDDGDQWEIVDTGIAVGINDLREGVNAAATQNVYNLNGQAVNKPRRGLYIVGGKKVVIK